ncbi:pyridoxamine 5'-phosphate oxidase family protein [Mangrovimonas spongiae]|uniref:Flavin mononucleotide-binding protein n=1 Tax=Mangrovimonas spongiae TaxID=2494697 RepID=A0A3R9PKL7_9FLAO|nr:pyridoxamine 5'-phosphate oxidase family protein [Mangrovimonas spongiae]RSK40434.1 flavin mononucleotide-binding protein [Mangrovimonas spongiae]
MITTLHNKERHIILERNCIGHLAYIHENRPFIAPITYFYNKEDNIIIGYSNVGHKIMAMRRHSKVAMEVSEINAINHWKSIVVHGVYNEIDRSEAKAYLHDFSLGVKNLISVKEHRTLDFISQFSSKATQESLPVVFFIKVENITGKMRTE